MSTPLRIDAEGLLAMGKVCAGHADALFAHPPAPSVEASFQPSAHVVSAVHADTAEAVRRSAERMRSTAFKVATAAIGYLTQDAENAADIRAVGNP